MKKLFALVLILLTLCACAPAETYIPKIDEIASNLEAAGYEIYEYDKLTIGDVEYGVMGVNAVKGYEFIDLCLEVDAATAEAIAVYYEDYFDSPEYIINLPEFEAVICCGSDRPVRDAGIKLTESDYES